MIIEYRCPNTDCQCETAQPYVVQLDGEAVMDEQNVATLFCPRCRDRLVRAPETTKGCTCC